MRKLIEDNIYTILASEYNELLLDYVLLSFNDKYCGQESHKKAVIKAISIFNTRKRVGNFFKHPYFYVDENKMCCVEYNSIEDFFYNREHWVSITSSFLSII